MKNNKITVIGAFMLGIITGLNELSNLLQTAINLGGEMDWIQTLDAIGTIILPIMFIYFIVKVLKMQEFYKQEGIDYREYRNHKDILNKIESHNNQLQKVIQDNVLKTTTSIRVLAQFINNMPEQEQKRLANIFYSEDIVITDLQKIGINKKLTDIMFVRYHEEQKNKHDESN